MNANHAIQARELVAQWNQSQAKRVQETDAQPFQFNLKLLLINMTLLALVFGISSFVSSAPNHLFGFTLYILLFGNWMYLAYRRRYPANQDSPASDPFLQA